MTDITPPNGFADAFAEAEAAALGEPAAPQEETAAPEQARNELGQFIPTHTPASSPAETAEEIPAPEETAAERLLAGKYKNVDDLERAYQELQSLSGRQGSELSELRQAFDQRFNELDARLQQQPPAAPVQITSDLIDDNPAYATMLAYEQGNETALRLAFDSWKQEDPASAASWAADERAKQREEQLRADYQQQLQALEQRIAPAADHIRTERVRSMQDSLLKDFPELRPDTPAAAQIAEIGREYPEIGANLDSRDVEVQLKALRLAAEIARGRSGDTLRATTQEVARQTAEEARAAAEDAAVVSSSNATSTATEQLSEEQMIAADVAGRFKARSDGWNSAWVRN